MRYIPPTGSTDPNAPYVGKNPAIGQQGSKVPPAAIEHTMREIVAVIVGAGLIPNESNLGQLWEAIQATIASGGTPDIGSFKVVTSAPSPSPPLSPASGDEVLVAENPTGAFAGHALQLARFNGSAWVFSGIRVGRCFRINGTNTYYSLTAGGWAAWTLPISMIENLVSELAARLQLSPAGGARQSIGGPLSIAGGTSAAPVGGALSGVLIHNGDAAYGLRAGVVAGDGRAWIQSGRVDGSATYYNVTINELGGRMAVGHANPLSLMDINGDVTLRADVGGPSTGHAFTIGANPIGNTIGGGFIQLYGSTASGENQNSVWLGAGGVNRVGVNRFGAIKVSGSNGIAGQVIATQGDNAPAHYQNVIDLLSASDLRAKLGGQTVWAAINCWGAKPANGTTPGNLLARGCTVTTNEFSSGNPVMVVTFSTPAPNASYVVMPDNGAVSSKTANGFTYGLGNLSSSIVDLEVYL